MRSENEDPHSCPDAEKELKAAFLVARLWIWDAKVQSQSWKALQDQLEKFFKCSNYLLEKKLGNHLNGELCSEEQNQVKGSSWGIRAVSSFDTNLKSKKQFFKSAWSLLNSSVIYFNFF